MTATTSIVLGSGTLVFILSGAYTTYKLFWFKINRKAKYLFLDRDIDLSVVETIKTNNPDGALKIYYDNGQLMSEENYEDGYLSGKKIKYYQSGAIEYSSFYKDGRLEGEYICYNEEGTKAFVENYISGILNGKKVTYHLNGRPHRKMFYKNGHYAGPYYEYDANGKIIRHSYFDQYGNEIE
jgi:antitoxin component YwqK of YwqJK toxin-antitoxin module